MCTGADYDGEVFGFFRRRRLGWTRLPWPVGATDGIMPDYLVFGEDGGGLAELEEILCNMGVVVGWGNSGQRLWCRLWRGVIGRFVLVVLNVRLALLVLKCRYGRERGEARVRTC